MDKWVFLKNNNIIYNNTKNKRKDYNLFNPKTFEISQLWYDTGTEKQDMDTVKQDIDTVKQDMDTVKQDMDTVKQDIDTVKQDMDTVKPDMDTVKQNVESVQEKYENKMNMNQIQNINNINFSLDNIKKYQYYILGFSLIGTSIYIINKYFYYKL